MGEFMRIAMHCAAALALMTLITGAAKAEMRCGWISNPTPANWWLTDADGEWTIMTQGGDGGPDGMDLMPDFTEKQWVRTNGYYGYGCACMDVETQDDRITRITSVRQLALSKCERDPKLKKQ
jgi:Protein of unknown function (DUF4087)